MQSFTDIKAWQRAHKLVLEVYRLTASFPSDERFGITSQLRRASASIPTNIAEGSSRKSKQDFARFLNIAEGSAAETKYLFLLCKDLGYIGEEPMKKLVGEVDEIARMLFAFREKVESD